jgi:hypothetical protein
MWRKLNGFPPEFYDQKSIKKETDSKDKKDEKKDKKK